MSDDLTSRRRNKHLYQSKRVPLDIVTSIINAYVRYQFRRSGCPLYNPLRLTCNEKEKRGWARDREMVSGSRRENWATESRVVKSDNGEVMAVAATVGELRYIANDDANDPLSRRRSLSGFPCARVSPRVNFVAGNGYDGKKIAGAIE